MFAIWRLILGKRSAVILSALAFVAGMGCIAAGPFLFVSTNPLDQLGIVVTSAAALFLITAAYLFLTTRNPSVRTRKTAARLLACLSIVIAPGTAIAAWPVLFCECGFLGLMLTPFVIIVCILVALVTSWIAGRNLAMVLKRWRYWSITVVLIFILQLVGILGSWPIFMATLNHLESQGYKVGWS